MIRFQLPVNLYRGRGISRSRDEIYHQNIPVALGAIMNVDEPPIGLGLDWKIIVSMSIPRTTLHAEYVTILTERFPSLGLGWVHIE